jgi:hypothetical protein
MIVETGHYALVLALALALVNSVLPVWGSVTRDQRLMAVAPPVALMSANKCREMATSAIWMCLGETSFSYEREIQPRSVILDCLPLDICNCISFGECWVLVPIAPPGLCAIAFAKR